MGTERTDTLMSILEKEVFKTVQFYQTNWTMYDRALCRKRVICKKPFVVLPRESGCYVVWPEPLEEGVESPKRAIWEYFTRQETATVRYLTVFPPGCATPLDPTGKGRIVEGYETARELMEGPALKILGRFSEVEYVLFRRDSSFQPFCAAWKFDWETETWEQGHYFSTEEKAREYITGLIREKSACEEADREIERVKAACGGEYEPLYNLLTLSGGSL